MTNFSQTAEQVKNTCSNGLDMISSQSSRSGTTIERVGKAITAGVSFKAIAVQLTENSTNGHTFTEEHVIGMNFAYEDNRSKVAITRKQTKALIALALLKQNKTKLTTSS